jgi:phosphatidate cytidylyltransferase
VLRTRLATAVVALPLLFCTVVYAPLAIFAGLVVGVSAAAAYEFFYMAFPAHPAQRFVGVILSIVVAAGVSAARPEFSGLAIACAVAGGLVFCLFDAESMAPAVTRAGYLVLGVVYAGFLLAHFVPLHRLPDGRWWVVFTIFVAMSSDTGAYFTGRIAGRRPLAARVSPKKTVEGAIGGLACGVLAAAFAHLIFLPRSGWPEVWLLGVAISTLSQLGDLTESMFKRAFGAKDSGWIIPGHGGILDRVDSLVFPAIFSFYFAALAYG